MNEVTQVWLANWASLIQQRNESGISKQWCAENNISENQYYWVNTQSWVPDKERTR